jgi:hypothetical protein
LITILFSGQSNCVGQGSGGTWDISPLVKVWNNETNRIDLDGLGNAWVTPNRNDHPFFEGNNNQGVQAANYLARITGQQVRLIIVGRGGESIKQWHNSLVTGPMYARLLAILDAACVSSVDWFLWNQGSADNGYAAYYAAKWNALIGQMTTDGVISANTPLVVSETAFLTPEINAALRSIAAADPRCGMAMIGTLGTIDSVHFSGPSLVKAGWESVYALSLTGSSLVPSLGGGSVYATGAGSVTFDPGVLTDVPFSSRYGDLDMIENGNFIARNGGPHKFTVSAYCAGWGAKVQLRDGAGDWIATVATSGSEDPVGNNAMLHGEIVLNLPPGAVIKVGMSHLATTARVISAAHSSAYNRMIVETIG